MKAINIAADEKKQTNLVYTQYVLVQAELNISNNILCNLKNTDDKSKSNVADYLLILIYSTRNNCNILETYICEIISRISYEGSNLLGKFTFQGENKITQRRTEGEIELSP
jgi:hypothetical protein